MNNKTVNSTINIDANQSNGLGSNKYFVLGVLGFINLFNYMDRNLFAVLIESIKADMHFSDSQLGILGGFSFALCYAIFGLLLGRLADRRNRVWLLSLALGVWSLASAFCGLAKNFTEFFLARVGVGIGEAGCVPSAHSLIGDYFSPQQRAFAVSVFTGIGQIGTILGIVLGASLADMYGWRTVFFIFGLPGLALALILVFLIKEPVRGRFDQNSPDHTKENDNSFFESVKLLLSKRTVRSLLIAIPLFYFVIGGAGIWVPSFYLREYGISISEYGMTGGISFGFGMLLGTLFGGVIVSYLIEKNRLWEFWLPALVSVISIPLYALMLLVDNMYLSFGSLGLASFVVGSGVGSSMSSLQVVADSSVRATAVGLMLLSTSLLAYGFGPFFVGMSSDFLLQFGWAENGAESLRVALLLSLVAPFLSAIYFMSASVSAKTEAVN